MMFRRVFSLLLRPRFVKSSHNAHDHGGARIPVAVRPITGLALAPVRLVRRATIAAMLGARTAVRTNTPEVVYLRTQHALYRGTAPRDVTAPVPDTSIDPATGELVIHAAADLRHPSDTIFDASDATELQGPVAAEAAFQRNASAAAGDAVARRLEEHEGDMRTVERQLREAEEQLERIAAEQNASAAARTQAFEDGTADVPAPTAVPSLSRIVLWRLFELATVVGEAANCFTALANTAGLDPSNLAAEWRNGGAPSIVGWGIAALTLAAILFIIAEWAFARIAAAIEEADDPTHAFRLATGVAALVFVTGVVAAIAYMRAQLGTAGHASVASWCVYFVVGAAPLVGGALVHLHTNALGAARAAALRVVATPTGADAAQQLRSEHEGTLVAERDRLRARRDQLTSAIQLLNRQMHGAEQAVRDVARHETMVVQRWLDSLRAALAKDQKFIHHFARAWNRTYLLAPALPAAIAGTLVPIRKRRTS